MADLPLEQQHRIFIAKLIAPGAYWGDPQSNHEQIEALTKADQIIGMAHHEVNRLMGIIDRDRYVAAMALNQIKEAMNGRAWVLEGRGPYAYDDDEYRQEFRYALESIEASLNPLYKLASDKTDCTTQEDRVVKVREQAQAYLREPSGPREMTQADLFGDPRDLEITQLTDKLERAKKAFTEIGTQYATAFDTITELKEKYKEDANALQRHAIDVWWKVAISEKVTADFALTDISNGPVAKTVLNPPDVLEIASIINGAGYLLETRDTGYQIAVKIRKFLVSHYNHEIFLNSLTVQTVKDTVSECLDVRSMNLVLHIADLDSDHPILTAADYKEAKDIATIMKNMFERDLSGPDVPSISPTKTIDPWQKPYADAGHDVESVFAAPTYKCKTCGGNQIDLSEDLAYGDVRPCKTLPQGTSSSSFKLEIDPEVEHVIDQDAVDTLSSEITQKLQLLESLHLETIGIDNLACLQKRRPDEPMFIILGRDPDGFNSLRLWAQRRKNAGDTSKHVDLVMALADRFEDYARNPLHKPQSAPDISAYDPSDIVKKDRDISVSGDLFQLDNLYNENGDMIGSVIRPYHCAHPDFISPAEFIPTHDWVKEVFALMKREFKEGV